jgi:hypothetical protein
MKPFTFDELESLRDRCAEMLPSGDVVPSHTHEEFRRAIATIDALVKSVRDAVKFSPPSEWGVTIPLSKRILAVLEAGLYAPEPTKKRGRNKRKRGRDL